MTLNVIATIRATPTPLAASVAIWIAARLPAPPAIIVLEY